jgi:uncharacterized protein (TIGR03032 family)
MAELANARLRVLFVVGAPGSGVNDVAAALRLVHDVYAVDDSRAGCSDDFEPLSPSHRNWTSDRLTAADSTAGLRQALTEELLLHIRNSRDVRATEAGLERGAIVETIHAGSLRVPFLKSVFPLARFVVVTRRLQEALGSSLEIWRQGKQVTHPQVPGWDGPGWTHALIPGWEELISRPLGEIVCHQWRVVLDILSTDLANLMPSDVIRIDYDDFYAGPGEAVHRICHGVGISAHGYRAPVLQVHPARIEDDLNGWKERANELFRGIEKLHPLIDPAALTSRLPSPAFPSLNASAETRSWRDEPTDQDAQEVQAVLEEAGVALAVSSYGGRLMVVPGDVNSKISSISLRTPLGVAVDGTSLYVAGRWGVTRLRHTPAALAQLEVPGADACFSVTSDYMTGEIGAREAAMVGPQLWVVSARFSCLASLDARYSFVPRWRPPFITQLIAEDRCHLNGLAVRDGQASFVSLLGISDSVNGWRDGKSDGGAILDVASGEVAAAGLSMPHSPRWHDGKLWVLESGRGALVTVDLASGRCETVGLVPGFARGLTFVGPYAVIGLSEIRESVFRGLPVLDRADLKSGLWIIDTRSGSTVAHMDLRGNLAEVFDIQIINGFRTPFVLDARSHSLVNSFTLPVDPFS